MPGPVEAAAQPSAPASAPDPESVVHLTLDHATDPYPLYQRLQADGGVHRGTTPDGAPVWIITRYTDVKAALADPRLSLNKQHATTGYTGFSLPPALDANLLNLDPPDHTRLRRLATAAFTPRRIEALRPRIHHTVTTLLDAAADTGHLDAVTDYAEPLPITVIGDLLGVPPEAGASMRTWTNTLLSPDPTNPTAARDAIHNIHTLITDLIHTKRTTPTDDLLSDLITTRDGADHLTEDELTSLAFLILWAGYENTVNLIATSLLTLTTHPHLATLVASQPTPDTPTMTALIEELLRINEPTQFAIRRFPTQPLTINHTTIPPGDTVLLSVAAANRDPHHFPHPDTITLATAELAAQLPTEPTTDATPAPTTTSTPPTPNTTDSKAKTTSVAATTPVRTSVDATVQTPPNGADSSEPLPRHLSFGHGIHYCLGAALARLETRIALWTLFHRHPHTTLAIDPTEVTWRPGFRRRSPHTLPLLIPPTIQR